jgi:ABC-type branched-subunit amino acid transport system substrate-binding protein
VDQEASHSPTYTVGEVGSAGAQEQNAVLQFRSANITEVLSLDNSSVSPLFMRYADSQGYKPRYGISTEDNPAIMTQVVPPAALVGSLGVGYDPVNDVVNPPLNSAGKKCDALMRAHGQPVGAYGACDQVRLIADALTASGVLTRDGLMSGLARLGNIESAQGILLNYGGGRRDGVAAARNLVFDGNNWRYSGPRYGLS